MLGAGVRRARVIVGLGVAALAGCGAAETDGYDQSLRYPARTDPIVIRTPSAEPMGLPPPGKLDASIRNLRTTGGELVLPDELSPDDRDAVTRTVDELFGTPADPRMYWYDGQSNPDEYLKQGSRVYSRLCANCHGLTGDGRGPVGPWSYPYPRDFRTGKFKVALGNHKPTPSQLVHVLRYGVPGTSMPLFDMLKWNDGRPVVSYVAHLSARGEVEVAGLKAAFEGDDPVAAVRVAAKTVVARWMPDAETSIPEFSAIAVEEADYADAVRRGKALFRSPAAGCAACHVDYGRTETFRYDVWGAPARVTDLTRGEFRWGRDDATLAARVRHGIPAAGMPASLHLTDDQVRDLVTFVRDLSAPARLPADVRAEVYPQAVSR